MTYGITASNAVMGVLFNNNILLAFTMLTAVVLPLLVLLSRKTRGKHA